MSWRKDWIYRLVFQEVESLWRSVSTISPALQELEQRLGYRGTKEESTPPDYLLISQSAEVVGCPYSEIVSSEEIPRGRPILYPKWIGPVRRQWRFDGQGLQIIDEEGTERNRLLVRGMYYHVGFVHFGISADRKVVALDYQVGPRYGKGRVFSVSGQGQSGRLDLHPDFMVWTS